MIVEEAAEYAKQRLEKALKKRANSTIAIYKEENEWVAKVEVLEEEHIPSKFDLIGIYQVHLDKDGNLISWDKEGTRLRG